MSPFVQSFSKHLLSTCSEASAALGTRETMMSRKSENFIERGH